MTIHLTAELIGYFASALGVAMVVPQIGRTLRDRTAPGVSALSWALTALACFSWLLYGLRTHELPQVPGNVLLVSGAVAVVLMVPSGTSMRVRGALLATAAVTIAGLSPMLPAAALGSVGFGIGLFSGIPQLVASLTRRTGGPSAVSVPTWMLRAASQACWLTYALLLSDAMVTVSAVYLLASALLVVVAELARPTARVRAAAHCVPVMAE